MRLDLVSVWHFYKNSYLFQLVSAPENAKFHEENHSWRGCTHMGAFCLHGFPGIGVPLVLMQQGAPLFFALKTRVGIHICMDLK